MASFETSTLTSYGIEHKWLCDRCYPAVDTFIV